MSTYVDTLQSYKLSKYSPFFGPPCMHCGRGLAKTVLFTSVLAISTDVKIFHNIYNIHEDADKPYE